MYYDEDDEIYGKIWLSQIDLTSENDRESIFVPKPPPRNESLKTYLSESDDPNELEEFSTKFDICFQTCKNFEGESVENLDIDNPTFEDDKDTIIDDNTAVLTKSKMDCLILENYKDGNNDIYPVIVNSSKTLPFPKKPCFFEFSDTYKLEYFGPIVEIIQKLTTNRKDRYGVLLTDRLVLFKKPEHKVSKFQIPINRITNIYWYTNVHCTTKNDCNKFKIDTVTKSYKFQCSSHENAGLWINHIAKLLVNRGDNVITEPPTYILKAIVAIENVKGKRVFTIEPNYTLAYYENEDDFNNDIAMHRIQLRSSGVRRDSHSLFSLELITSYRKYKLSFESIDICNKWCTTLSTIIPKAISSTSVAQSVKSGDKVMSEIYTNISNRFCADCNKENPEWASVNLFITLCSDCSGIHRGLGRHISSIQGILTDELKWQDINVLQLFSKIGNKNANDFFLKTYSNNVVDRRFIYDKYVRKSFIGRKDAIFAKYNDKSLLNEEFLNVVKTNDVIKTMCLFHIGADINYVDELTNVTVFKAAEDSGQFLQLTFLNNQSKDVIRDWRNELFDRNNLSEIHDIPFQERLLLCSINSDKQELRRILIWSYFIQIFHDDTSKMEICKVLFENICLVREKQQNLNDQIYLNLIVRETEFTSKMSDTSQTINIIELTSSSMNNFSDIKDFKNVIALKMCPFFKPINSFDCIGWIILSTPTKEWKPYLLVLNSNRYLDFHDPEESNNNTIFSFKLDLRKVQKIEEMRDKSYGSSCPFKMYNLASICLISSDIYHIRSDTKFAHDEHLEAFRESWNKHDFSLSNQFLTKDNVPLAVHKMVQFLQLHGSNIEGPFRRVGSVKEAEKIYNELIKDPGSFMLKDCTAYDVASALKLFFRKLDDPLLTNTLFEYWIAAVGIKDPKEQLEYYKSIVDKLPPVNYKTLRLLIFLFVEIIRNYEITQMDPSNLSTSFNNCLLISGSQDQSFSQTNLQILPFLINNYQYLFMVSQEEINKEEIIRKGLNQICNEKTSTESTLLRQIYVDLSLENFLKNIINFEKECINEKNETTFELYTKQMNIEQSMTSTSLISKIFNEFTDKDKTILFEDRYIEDFHMHRLIYPYENLFTTIISSEVNDPKSSRKWIFKLDTKFNAAGTNHQNSFQCWCYFSHNNRNRIYVELNETGQLNLWKNDQASELLVNFPLKNILLYRSCKGNKKTIVIKDSKAATSTLSFPKFIQNLTSKSKCYNYITFSEEIDYASFLKFYDQYKVREGIHIHKKNIG